MDNLIITQAVKEDLPIILDIQRKAFGEVAKTFYLKSMPQIEQTLESLTAEFNNCTFLKASLADTIVGSVRAYRKDNTCYIHRLIVLPQYQNNGIGKALMAEIENQFKSNVARYELFTGSRDPRNLYLYDKLGYKTFKTEKHNHGYKPQTSIGKSFCSKIWGLIPSALRDCSANRFRCASPGIRRSSLSESEFHNDEISFVYMEKSAKNQFQIFT
jgi:ribosomal protein S18 acetylase RimI-like enzyme